MSTDHATTTPEAAAEHARLTTPAIHPERPDASECVGVTVDPDPALSAWLTAIHVQIDRERYEQTRSWR